MDRPSNRNSDTSSKYSVASWQPTPEQMTADAAAQTKSDTASQTAADVALQTNADDAASQTKSDFAPRTESSSVLPVNSDVVFQSQAEASPQMNEDAAPQINADEDVSAQVHAETPSQPMPDALSQTKSDAPSQSTPNAPSQSRPAARTAPAHEPWLVGAAEGDVGHGARKRFLVGRNRPKPEAQIDGTVNEAPGYAATVAATDKKASFGKVYHPPGKSPYFKSRYIADTSKIDKPWLYGKRDPREKWQTIIPMCGFLIGLGIAGFLMWQGYESVSRNLYCEALNEDFSSGTLNESIWSTEIGVKGFG